MLDSLRERFDAFGRHHPGLMLAATMLLGLATTIILLLSGQQVVLYEAF